TVTYTILPDGPTSSAPTVNTTAASTITPTSGTLGGNVTADGGATVTERGIVWGTTTNPTTANNRVAIEDGTGSFSQTIGLPGEQTIYVRTYAVNYEGTSYGSEESFITPAAIVPGNGLAFDGTDDYVEIGTSTTFDARTMKTIEAWVKFASFS